MLIRGGKMLRVFVLVALALLPILTNCQPDERNPCPICFKLEPVPSNQQRTVCMPDPKSAECAPIAQKCADDPCTKTACPSFPNAICRSGALCEPHFYDANTFEELDCIGRCSQVKCPTQCHRCAIILGIETCVIDNNLNGCSAASACMPNPCIQCQTCQLAPGKPEHLVPPLNYACTPNQSCVRDGQCPQATNPPSQDDCIGPCQVDGDCPFSTKCCQSCCREIPMAFGNGFQGFGQNGVQ